MIAIKIAAVLIVCLAWAEKPSGKYRRRNKQHRGAVATPTRSPDHQTTT
jgi:hypothetical protein